MGAGGPWAALSHPLVGRSPPGLVAPAPPPPLTNPVGGKSPSVGSSALPTPGRGHFGGCKTQGKRNNPAPADVSKGHLWSLHRLGHPFSSRLYCCPSFLPQAVCHRVAGGKALRSLSSAVASASPIHLNQSACGPQGQEAGDTALGADGVQAMPTAMDCHLERLQSVPFRQK